MTYRELLSVLENLEKKDSLLVVNDRRLVPARLSYCTLSMTRYDNGKLVQNGIRTLGAPVENIPEKNYLCIISTGERGQAVNTLKIRPYAHEWVAYLKTLPDLFLDQNIVMYSRIKGFGANDVASFKGGIGLNNVLGIAYTEKHDIQITTNSEQSYRSSLIEYCRSTGCTPYFWGEVVVFDMNKDSLYTKREIFKPLEENV